MIWFRYWAACLVVSMWGSTGASASGIESAELAGFIAELGPAPRALSGDFEQQKKFNGIPKILKSKGLFEFKKGELVWKQVTPVSSSILYRDGKVTQVIGDQPPTEVTNQAAAFYDVIACVINPTEACILKNFSITQLARPKGQRWTVSLEPRNDMFRQAINLIALEGVGSDVSDVKLVQKDCETVIHLLHVKKSF